MQLADARSSRGLTVAAVAERLLLSTRQVRALEAFDLSAFHNPRFYTTALRKYAAFVAVDPALVERAARSAPVTSDWTPVTVPSQEAPSAAPAVRGLDFADATPHASGARVAWAVVAVLGIGGAGYFVWQRTGTAAAPIERVSDSRPASSAVPPPPAPVARMEASSVPGPATPATSPVMGAESLPSPSPADHAAATGLPPTVLDLPKVGPSGSYGAVRVAKPTWMFLRYAQGQVVERNLREGEAVTFEAAPVYLALGSTEVELTLADRAVDITPFIVNGQVRMRATDLAMDTGR